MGLSGMMVPIVIVATAAVVAVVVVVLVVLVVFGAAIGALVGEAVMSKKSSHSALEEYS